MRLQVYPCVQALYQEMYRQATLHSSFKYKSSLADRKLTCKFIIWLQKVYRPHQINEALLIQFFEFQFSRYSGVITPRGKNNVMLNWIIGPKAIWEWEHRTVSKRWLVRWRINKDFHLKLKKFVNVAPPLQVINEEPFAHEEKAKARFYGQPEGYVYCAQFTTLFNPYSSLCNKCEFMQPCAERLKMTYNNLYQKRMGEFL
jgi:hypothetical protein